MTAQSTSRVKNKVTTSTLHPGLHKYPAFYACYLLRSYQNGKPNPRTYVGSTPDPPRRIRQHNGQLKGGAARTKYYRPWEMELICYGFPSKLVALQFEWAWNTPYKSRHLQIAQATDNQTKLDLDGTIADKTTPAPKNKKPMFPRSMGNRVEVKLKVLRTMITSLPWSQYPLKVLFFEEGAYQLWLQQADPTKSVLKNTQKGKKACSEQDLSVPYPYPIEATFRPEGVDGMRKLRRGLPTSVEDQAKPIEVHDEEAMLEDYEKLQAIKRRSNDNLKCYFCKESIDIEEHLLYVNCQSSDCFMLAHILCLSKHFLSAPTTGNNPALQSSGKVEEQASMLPRVLPDRGTCPMCSTDLRWGELIKSCYRRMPKNPTKAQLSASDDDNSVDLEGDDQDLNLDSPESSAVEDFDGLPATLHQGHHRSNSHQTKKKLPPARKPGPAKAPSAARSATANKKINSKGKRLVRKQVDDDDDDEPEQDFLKMMDELQVSSDSD